MSTDLNPPPAVAPAPQPLPTSPSRPDEVRVVAHSNIFYWWPVWAVGLIMALWTWFLDGHLMVTVPKQAETFHASELTWTVPGTGADKDTKTRSDVDLVVVAGKKLPRNDAKNVQPDKPKIHMAESKNLGVIFCITLLIVILITNVPLRGMWSVVAIITIVLMTVILALAGVWEWVLNTLDLLDIRINGGGYLFISGALFLIWGFAVFFFDRQRYIVFTPGQFKVCESIGEGEKVYDTVGLTFERQRGDIFRHYILGLGSGDLIVRTTGAQSHQIELPNVLFIHRKVKQIEDLLREVTTVSDR